MRSVDHQRPAIDIDHVHGVELAGGVARVRTIGDMPLGPASELPVGCKYPITTQLAV